MISSTEIGTIQDEKEKKLQKAITELSLVEQEILLRSREIITLQGEKKDLEYSKSKANQNVQVLRSELRVLKNQFWATKNSGM